MQSWESSPVVMAILLVVLGILAVGVSLWRVLQGSPGQRARGILSLVLIFASVGAFLWALHAMVQVNLTGPGQSVPGSNAPDIPTVPTGPSFATPANVISAP